MMIVRGAKFRRLPRRLIPIRYPRGDHKRHPRGHKRRYRRRLPSSDVILTEGSSQTVPMSSSAPGKPKYLEFKPDPSTQKMLNALPGLLAKDVGPWLHLIATQGGPECQIGSEHTVKSYRASMVTFGRWIKEYLVGLLFYKEFTLLHAKTYIEYLVSKGFKPASIVVKRAALKSFWDYLVLWGEASTNPFDQVCVPNPPSLPKHPFSEKEDVDMLPEFVRAGKWYPAFLIMRFAGLRLSETLALSPADITLSADDLILRIHVRSGNGKERWAAMVPCDNRTTRPYFYQDIVWEAVKARWNDKFLFEAGKGGVFSTYRTMIRKGWLPKGFTPHRLRDTFANWLRMEGCREGTVGALLGHEDILTKMYGSRRPEYVEREFLKQWKALGNLKASWI